MVVETASRDDFDLAFDARPAARRIGLLLLATDHTTERDFARHCSPDEVGVYVGRIAFENPTVPDNLQRMLPRLSQSVALILPGERLDVLCYSCTAASVIMGDEVVEATVQEAKPDVPVVTPARAARLGLDRLGHRRISILTPYVPEVGEAVAAYFRGHGFEIAGVTCFGLEDDRDMARVSPDSLVAAACEAAAPDADALFISCTALRAFEVVEAIEERIGRPVVTSNQASLWLSLRHVGIERPVHGAGRLLMLSGPAPL